MEVQTLFNALLKAGSFKAGASLVVAFSLDFLLPLSGFMLAGLSVVIFEGVLKGIVNVKSGRSWTDNGVE